MKKFILLVLLCLVVSCQNKKTELAEEIKLVKKELDYHQRLQTIILAKIDYHYKYSSFSFDSLEVREHYIDSLMKLSEQLSLKTSIYKRCYDSLELEMKKY